LQGWRLDPLKAPAPVDAGDLVCQLVADPGLLGEEIPHPTNGGGGGAAHGCLLRVGSISLRAPDISETAPGARLFGRGGYCAGSSSCSAAAFAASISAAF